MTYGRWKPAPPLWPWFKKMQERSKYFGIACTFSNDEDGYGQFCEAIGPIPEEMKRPTVSRFDHDKGYTFDNVLGRWNFRWQEQADNSRESAMRTNFGWQGNAASATSPAHNSRQVVECPHCGRLGKLPPMKRWHFDNCWKIAS